MNYKFEKELKDIKERIEKIEKEIISNPPFEIGNIYILYKSNGDIYGVYKCWAKCSNTNCIEDNRRIVFVPFMAAEDHLLFGVDNIRSSWPSVMSANGIYKWKLFQDRN